MYGQNPPIAKYVILMIADGWGAKHIEATNQYCTNEGICGSTPAYQDPDWNPGGALWKKEWISTYSYGGSYNTNSAWSTFNYVLTGAITDSAAAASVLYTGVKTDGGNVSVNHNDISRLFTIGEKAKDLGKGVGAVSTVPVSHATPAAWVAHNNTRSNYYAIADEGFFGNPSETCSITLNPPDGICPDSSHGGSHGSTLPPSDVLIGDARSTYVNSSIRTELQNQHNSGKLYYVNCPSTEGDPAGADGDGDGIYDDGDSSGTVGDNPCIGGNTVNCDDNCVNTINADQADSDSDGFGEVCDCQQLLLNAANSPGDMRIAGLFERPCVSEESGCYSSNPTLSESVSAALKLLGDTNKYPNGAIFMFEGGAVDWAGHGNDMESMITEMRDFNEAVDTVINWVNDGTNGSDWSNTMVIVTGDHECGYLTPKSGIFPDQPLGLVNNDTIKVTGSCSADKKGEKIVSGSGGRRASWNDLDCDNVIDGGETVYWAWNSGGHSNSLIPLYCRGAGCNLFSYYYETTQDLKRGYYLDNRHVWSVMNTVLIDVPLLSAPTVSNIDSTSAAMGATIDYDGESTITERGTVWDGSSSPVANQLAEGGAAVGTFSHNRTGLPEGGLIYYRGYAANAAGNGYSPDGFFYTEPTQVSDVIINNVTDTSMHITWTDNSVNSSQALVLMRMGSPVDSVPVDGNSYLSDSIFGSGEQLGTGDYVVFASTGTQVDVAGLSPWTTYHVAVYAYAGAGTMINYQQDAPAVASRESCTDTDGDTYAIEGGGCGSADCNDSDSAINPGAAEICDSIDNDCDSQTDEGLTNPTVSTTVPPAGATGVPPNSSVTINWDENVDCATVNATNITSGSPGWALSGCSGNQAVFITSGQSGETTYTVTVTTAVTNASGCAMEANYQFSFRTNVSTTLSIMEPNGVGDTITAGDPYLITYTLNNPDKVVNAAFYDDTDNDNLDGTAIAGACSAAPEGTGVTCAWNTAGMLPGEYYVYGITNLSGSGITRIWTGGGADTFASNPANWSGNLVPQDGDDVVFNGTSVKGCNWDMDVSIHSISLNPGYKGTVTITSPLSLTGDSIIADGRLIAGDTVFYGNGRNAYSPGPITIN